MANVDLEVAGYLRRLIDIGASSDYETGAARETYSQAVTLVDGSGNVVTPGSGALTNNNAAPGTNNTGVLSALANAAVPSWSEGKQVLLSTDLSGNQRTTLGTLISGEDQGNNILRVGGKGSGWNITHAPAVNTKATISQAAGGGTVRNVITGFSFGASTGTSAPSAVQLTINLRDGATGAGTILQSWTVVLPASVGYNYGFGLSGLWIECSQNTATTIEYSAAGGANTFEAVNLIGCTIAA
jgi:hypothetical protein